MEQWLPRRPLILTPVIPLAWTVSWLGIVTALQSIGFAYPDPRQLQESVLIVSALIVVANIYNLILIYRHAEQDNQPRHYSHRSFLLAIILIVSIVIAWGQPQRILLPTRLTGWVAIYLLLNFSQALLGLYFVQLVTPTQGRRKRASLLLPVAVLTVAGFGIPVALLIQNNWPVSLVGCSLLLALVYGQWVNLPGLFLPTAASKSGTYQILRGINLTTTVTTVFFGLDTFIMAGLGEKPDLISYCFVLSLLGIGISGILISAMQRYQNDYRYGHAQGREAWYMVGGVILTVTVLIINCWFVK